MARSKLIAFVVVATALIGAMWMLAAERNAASANELVPGKGFALLATLNANTSAPTSPLVQAGNGMLYGTTTNSGPRFTGSVFTLTPQGTVTLLGIFEGAIGSTPQSGLILATDGNLYGTAMHGGEFGFGTVYRVTAAGKATAIHSFCSRMPCPDGKEPSSRLVEASDGNLYGTAGSGTGGIVYRITLDGDLTVIYRFDAATGPYDPAAGLIEGRDGNLYGSTEGGGAEGNGTIYRMTLDGVLTTLHSFSGEDGSQPLAALVEGKDGNFYGSTYLGGNTNGTCGGSGCGVLFKISSGGTFTTLYKFDGADGRTPESALVSGSDGNLYGTTIGGGSKDEGTIFRITRSGTLTTLYSFCPQSGCADGEEPNGLVQDTNGVLYGTTAEGGQTNDGTVFSFSLGLPQFVRTLPQAAPVGAPVTVIGTNLAGTSSVTFNGTSATFTVVSHSRISTSVPNGATTGAVDINTPRGTLSSDLPFEVLQ